MRVIYKIKQQQDLRLLLWTMSKLQSVVKLRCALKTTSSERKRSNREMCNRSGGGIRGEGKAQTVLFSQCSIFCPLPAAGLSLCCHCHL